LKDKIFLSINTFVLQIILVLATGVLVNLLPVGNPDLLLNDTVLNTTLAIAVFAGVFEELVFRLALTWFNAGYLAFSLSGLVFIAIKKIGFHSMLLKPEGFLVAAGIAVVCFPVFFFIIKRSEGVFNQFWQKHFGAIFYFSAALFALSHFFNAQTLDAGNLKATVPLFVGALFLGFLRARAGLLFAIVAHVIWDLFL
jgi:hypothetical protein